MASDLEQNLINGGVSPAAAKILSNAISNVASAQLDLGRRYGDATPRQQLRMVDADSRKYVLTNLDHSPEAPFSNALTNRGNRYTPKDTAHPYADSQPATAQATLATPSVKGGDYIDTVAGSKDSVAQTTVSARVSPKGGVHARLNTSTKTIEAVPFSVEVAQEQFVEASFEERATGTVLKLRMKNPFSTETAPARFVSADFEQQGTGTVLTIRLTNLGKFVDKNGTAFWGFADV